MELGGEEKGKGRGMEKTAATDLLAGLLVQREVAGPNLLLELVPAQHLGPVLKLVSEVVVGPHSGVHGKEAT